MKKCFNNVKTVLKVIAGLVGGGLFVYKKFFKK